MPAATARGGDSTRRVHLDTVLIQKAELAKHWGISVDFPDFKDSVQMHPYAHAPQFHAPIPWLCQLAEFGSLARLA